MVREVSSDLPPGFRFHPTDEELIMYYLRNQATSRPCPVSIIPEVDIYKFDPWELPDKTQIGENEWYFFSPRDRKYPNGVRPNRAAVSGYWKATGTDKPIYSGSKYVGVKKALVFYKGRPPKGIKTDWIMHEYRLSEYQSRSSSSQAGPNKLNGGSMRLDDWVLCRIYKKRIIVKPCEQQGDLSVATKVLVDDSNHRVNIETHEDDQYKFPRTFSLSHLWDFGNYVGSISQLPNENLYNNNNSNMLPFDINTARVDEKFQLGQVLVQKPCTTDAVKFGVVNESIMFVDPVFGFQR